MRLDPPTEILLKTEKVTLALEGIGDGKIRCSASSWEDAKVILGGQVLMARANGKRLRFLRRRAPKTWSKSGQSISASRATDRASRVTGEPGRGLHLRGWRSGQGRPYPSWWITTRASKSETNASTTAASGKPGSTA